MTKYLFLDIPCVGHINPTLAVVQELVKQGHQVSYYLPERFRSAIQATGATFRSYQSQVTSRWAVDASGLLQMSPDEMVDESYLVLPQVLDRIRAEQPDCLVYDRICIWGHIVAHVLNVPAIVLHTTYVMKAPISSRQQQINPDLEKSGLAWKKLCESHLIRPFNIDEIDAPLNIVFLPKEWQPNGHLFDEHYLFVGPSIFAHDEESDFPFDQLSNTLPMLYISLGTVVSNQPTFFQLCLEAFGGQRWQVVLSVGRRVDLAALGPIPDNFLVAPYVPQLEILSRTHVFLTHAGMNSTMESLSYGVPMVAIPQTMEQNITARRIAQLGLGVMLERKAVNAVTLREAVERVADDTSFRQRAQIMQRIIRREPSGYQRAAEALIQFAQEQVKGHESPSRARLC